MLEELTVELLVDYADAIEGFYLRDGVAGFEETMRLISCVTPSLMDDLGLSSTSILLTKKQAESAVKKLRDMALIKVLQGSDDD